jgi:hypothetical protein
LAQRGERIASVCVRLRCRGELVVQSIFDRNERALLLGRRAENQIVDLLLGLTDVAELGYLRLPVGQVSLGLGDDRGNRVRVEPDCGLIKPVTPGCNVWSASWIAGVTSTAPPEARAAP